MNVGHLDLPPDSTLAEQDRCDRIDRCARRALAGLALALLALELPWHPIKKSELTQSWGSEVLREINSRGPIGASPSDWSLDPIVLGLELALLALLFAVAIWPASGVGLTGSQRLGRAALVFYSGFLLLPLVSLDSTLWVAAQPLAPLFIIYYTAPLGAVVWATKQSAANEADISVLRAERRLASSELILGIALAGAVIGTFMSFSRVMMLGISPFGMGFVLTEPLSGAWATTIALWLSFASLRILQSPPRRRRRITESSCS